MWCRNGPKTFFCTNSGNRWNQKLVTEVFFMDNVNRIRVGFFAPDFRLKDSRGKMIRLYDFLGKKNVLLFFFDGKNCGFCLDWLSELKDAYGRIQSKNAEIICISRDEKWMSQKLKEEKGIEFPILKDGKDTEDGTPDLSERYGVQIQESERTSIHPAFFVIDKRGIIRYRKVLNHSTKKLVEEELLCELDQLS
jgi:peroxiredoxin Q/BCP